MPDILFPGTRLVVGDPERAPFADGRFPSSAEIDAALASCVLSASGWRAVFADSDDSLDPRPAPAKLYLAACMALAFADFVKERTGGVPVVALGIDTRPTGPALADACARVMLGSGVEVRYPFVVAAPEIMAWTRAGAALPADAPGRLSGFCYISASHNPPGHNGFKFGLGSGGVLAVADANPLAERLRALVRDGATRERLAAALEAADAGRMGRLYASCKTDKRLALSAYLLSSREVAAGTDDLTSQEAFFERLSKDAARAAETRKARSLGIVADFNGSARALSIDEDYLASLGIGLRAVNAAPGVFAHGIVPEGDNLERCRKELEAAHAEDPGFILGYVPDCDGDRGNLVAWDDALGAARALEAQETFALAVLAELGDQYRSGLLGGVHGAKAAVVCNDATSLRIDRIASVFRAETRRAETGEANVVALADSLRERGWTVRVTGEGSNGGNITHPSRVRDPLSTLVSIVKLLASRDEDGVQGIFHAWLELLGRGDSYRDDFAFSDVVASLPVARTTGAFESRAALRVRTGDHAALKRAFQAVFTREWPALRDELRTLVGADRFDPVATIGIEEIHGLTDLGEAGKGGLKLRFARPDGVPVAFMWMRGSGTEPVLRAVADVCLEPEADLAAADAAERRLHGLLVALIREADASAL